MRILAIDPGEKHCGLAYFEDTDSEWHVVSSWEEEPDECVMTAYRLMTEEGLNVLVVEEFRLYPWKSEQQGFSQIKTVEVIGVLRYLHMRAAALLEGHGALPVTEWREQGASIKKPTAAICNAKGIKTTPKSNRHMKDAQLHGWYYILKELEGEDVE